MPPPDGSDARESTPWTGVQTVGAGLTRRHQQFPIRQGHNSNLRDSHEDTQKQVCKVWDVRIFTRQNTRKFGSD